MTILFNFRSAEDIQKKIKTTVVRRYKKGTISQLFSNFKMYNRKNNQLIALNQFIIFGRKENTGLIHFRKLIERKKKNLPDIRICKFCFKTESEIVSIHFALNFIKSEHI